MKANSIMFYVAGLIAIILVARLVMPYPLPEAQTIALPEFTAYSRDTNSSYINTLMANNLWDRKRGALEARDSVGGELGVEGTENNFGDGGNSSWQLVGVAFAENQEIAVIKSGDVVRNIKPGDQLPDGAEVVKILPYGIQTTKLGKNDNIYLFGKK